MMIEMEVVEPRTKERGQFGAGHSDWKYNYESEPFRMRRKDFWPLQQAEKLLSKFIPNLSHESDGLILQVAFHSSSCCD